MVRTRVIGILCGLSLWSTAGAKNITSDNYFYGQSHPAYPSRMYLSSVVLFFDC